MISDVAIDLDGVVYPFAQEFYKFCSKALDTNDLPAATRWHFYEDWGLTEEEYLHLLHEASNAGVFVNGEPPVGAQAAWNAISAMGAKIHVITARPPESWADTTWWLDQWKLRADALHFTEDKWLFAYMLGDGKGMLLDDSPKYLQSLDQYDGVIPVVYDQPWNRDVDFLRVNTLMGFARLVALYNRQEKEQW